MWYPEISERKMTVCLKEFRLDLDVEKMPEIVINNVLFTGWRTEELGVIRESEIVRFKFSGQWTVFWGVWYSVVWWIARNMSEWTCCFHLRGRRWIIVRLPTWRWRLQVLLKHLYLAAWLCSMRSWWVKRKYNNIWNFDE